MKNDPGSTRLMALIAISTGVLAFVIVVSGRSIGGVEFKPFDLTAFTTALAPALVIAVMIERFIQVFFGVWREPGDRVAQHAADAATAAAMTAEPAAVADARAKQAEVEDRKAANTRLAFLSGGTLGILASLAGVRVLSLLLAKPAGSPRWWTLLDVLLTGGLLGGGADGFHQITSALSSFLKATQQKAKDTATVSKLAALTPSALPNGRTIVAVDVRP